MPTKMIFSPIRTKFLIAAQRGKVAASFQARNMLAIREASEILGVSGHSIQAMAKKGEAILFVVDDAAYMPDWAILQNTSTNNGWINPVAVKMAKAFKARYPEKSSWSFNHLIADPKNLVALPLDIIRNDKGDYLADTIGDSLKARLPHTVHAGLSLPLSDALALVEPSGKGRTSIVLLDAFEKLMDRKFGRAQLAAAQTLKA